MFNITGKFVTVFDPSIKLDKSERTVFATLSTSKKNTAANGTVSYVNMTWLNSRFVGEAFEPAKALRNGDKIDIIRGSIENRYDKEKKILYVDVTVFEFAISDTSKNKGGSTAPLDGEVKN